MTDRKSQKSPDLARAAKKGNLRIDLGEKIDEAIEDMAERKAAEKSKGLSGVGSGSRFSPALLAARHRWGGYGTLGRPGGYGYSYGGAGRLGAVTLVTGEVKAGQVLLGLITGLGTGKLSQVGLHKLGANELLANGLLAGTGVVVALAGRKSFWFGLGSSLTLPILGNVFDWLFKVVGIPAVTPGAMAPALPAPPSAAPPAPRPIAGAGYNNRQLGQQALSALEQLKARIVPATA